MKLIWYEWSKEGVMVPMKKAHPLIKRYALLYDGTDKLDYKDIFLDSFRSVVMTVTI